MLSLDRISEACYYQIEREEEIYKIDSRHARWMLPGPLSNPTNCWEATYTNSIFLYTE